MSLAIGTRLGVYEVLALIGEGGMGQVYRARDTVLGRDVAIKVLPDAFAHEPERLARFEREARTLASLNHPHIAAIYAVEKTNGLHALVMELVDGEDMSRRLTRGAIPPDDAVALARQIADALEVAHEQGIVHRDLKPANVKVRPDGTVKVLDFGLAKVVDGGAAPSDRPLAGSQMPTVTSPALMTGPGMILGTAAYMAPEQARGKTADRRADIWAFGAVLYEMLTGTRAFAGAEVSDVLASVLAREPEWTRLPATVAPSVVTCIRRCLQKDPRQRFGDMQSVRLALDGAFETAPPRAGATAPPPAALGSRAWMAAFGLALIAAVALAVPATRSLRGAPPADEVRLQIVTPPAADAAGEVSFALSPDGRSLVFQAQVDGVTQLWLRPLGSDTARPLPGTENARGPFWSPDSASVGFFAAGQIRRFDVSRGTVQMVTNTTGPPGASWSADGVILFDSATTGSIARVPASGGEPTEATHITPPQHSGHRFPEFLPDGRRFIFYAFGQSNARGVYIGSLDSTVSTRLLAADSRAAFLPPDRLVFLRAGALLAQRVDFDRLVPVGDPVTVAEGVTVDATRDASLGLSVTATGWLAYRPARPQAHQMSWLNRTGQRINNVGMPDPFFAGIARRVSPDGRTLAIVRDIKGNRDIWLEDVARGIQERLTFDEYDDENPVWSPDGTKIAFRSDRVTGGGRSDLFVRALNGNTADELLLESSENKIVQDWSPDGRFILFMNASAKTGPDIFALPLDGDKKPIAVLQSEFAEPIARFSPDGRWIAYVSNLTGRNEVYVRAFQGSGRSWRISTDGGTAPQWRGDGREIFYEEPERRLMAATVSLGADTVDAGAPVLLFSSRSIVAPVAAADGQRFLVIEAIGDPPPPTITIVQNPRAAVGH